MREMMLTRKNWRPRESTANGRSGFTLVEVLVSSIITLLMITAAVGVMRHGQQVQALDQQRNRARQHMVTELEKIQYAHANFDSLALQTLNDSLVLDDRGTASPYDDLKATTVLTVASSNITINGNVVPRKVITMSASWSSLDGSETMVLEKWICKVLL